MNSSTEKTDPVRNNRAPIVVALVVVWGFALVGLVSLMEIAPSENPFEVVISAVAKPHGWQRDEIEMSKGTTTRIAFLNWTKVELLVHSETAGSVSIAARKMPFCSTSISCYSVGKRCTT